MFLYQIHFKLTQRAQLGRDRDRARESETEYAHAAAVIDQANAQQIYLN